MDARAYRTLQDESVRLLDEEDFASAAPLVDESLAAAKALFGDAHVETADCLYNLGSLQRRTGKSKKAIATLARAAAVYAKLGAAHRESAARAIADMANVLVSEGDFAKGKDAAARAIAEYRALGVRDDDYAIAMSDLGRCELEARQYHEAIAAYEESMTMLGDDIREALFDTKSRFGVELMESDRKRAAKLFDETVALAAKLPAKSQIQALLNVAGCAVFDGRPADGARPAQQALELARRLDSKPELAAALFRRGDVHVCLGDHASGVPLLERAVEIQSRLDDAPTLVEYERLLGISLLGAELYARAAKVLAHAIPIAKRRIVDDPETYDAIEDALIDALWQNDEPARALRFCEPRVKRLAKDDPKSTAYANAVEYLAHLCDDLERRDRACELYTRVIALRARIVPKSADLALAWNNLALHHALRKNYDAADDAFAAGLAILDELYGADDERTREVIRESADELDDALEHCPRLRARAAK